MYIVYIYDCIKSIVYMWITYSIYTIDNIIAHSVKSGIFPMETNRPRHMSQWKPPPVPPVMIISSNDKHTATAATPYQSYIYQYMGTVTWY